MTTLAVLRRPGIGRLGAAGLLSEIGDWMLLIALPLYVLQMSGSALVTATVFALELVPAVVCAPFVGVLIDATDPWRLMKAIAIVQAAALLPLLWADSADDLWIVYAVAVAQSVLGTVIEPSRAVTAAAIVPPSELLTLNQSLGVLSSLARLIGGPLGGITVGWGGITAVVLADAATFLLTALILQTGRPRQPRPSRRSAGSGPVRRPITAGRRRAGAPAGWRAGLLVIARTPALRRVLTVCVLAALAQGGFVVLFVLFVIRDLHGTEADVGLLRGVQAVGAIVGGVVLGAVAHRFRAGRLVAGSLAVFGLLTLAIWNAPLFTTSFGLYVALFIVVGLPGLLLTTGMLTIVQSSAVPDVRGRVLSTFYAVGGAAQAAGMLLAGLVGTGGGLTVALQVQGVLYLIAAGLALRLPA